MGNRISRPPPEASRDAFEQQDYRWQVGQQRLPWWFLMKFENSQAIARTEFDVVREQRAVARIVRKQGSIHGEYASPEGVVQFSDRIERCAWCEAPYTDSEEVEVSGDPNYDLCPRCRQCPDDDPLLRAIDRGIDDEGLDRLIDHYAKNTPYFKKGDVDGEVADED